MSALATLEAACLALHAPATDETAQRKRAEAEAVLEHFKRSPDALAEATSLVRAGTPAVVLFHCVATVREVTLKKWPVLSPQERSQPMDLLMQFLWQHYAQLPPFVSGALLQTVVLLMKRGWLERAPAERHAIIQQMGAMMGSSAGQDDASSPSIVRRLVAAKWILAFVTEFSSASRSSAMFQPVEFHTEARKTLRRGGLKELLAYAIQLQQDLIQTTTMCSTQDGHLIDVPKAQLELLETAFSLVVEILNWDFADSLGNLAWSLSANDAGTEESRTTISPDESWRDVLVRPELIHSAFNTYAFFRNLKNKNDNLLHLARQFLIQLASLRGPLFHNRNEKVQFLGEIFRGTSAIIHDPFLNMVAKNDLMAYEIATREMIDMCQLLFRIVNNLGLQAFVAGAPPELFSTFLNELSSLSCTLLASALEKIRAHLLLQNNETVEDLWQLEGVDVLLDAWVALINDSYLDTFAPASEPLGKEAQMISDALSQYSAPVVDLYLQVQLELCAVNALAEKDEDEDIEDNSAAGAREQFELAAALARMNASSSSSVLLKLLQAMLTETQQCLAAMQGREEITPALGQLYEKVHFLVEFTGLFLADDFKSERPRIPTRIHRVFFSGSNGSEAPGTDIINLLLLVTSQFLQFEATRVAQNPNNEAISPFVSEQILATTTRLCVTYLAPDVAIEGETGIAPLLLQVFGLNNGGRAGELIQFLVQQCTVYLIHWPTQPIVMENLMDFLLELSKSKAMSSVLQSPFWQSIIQANGAAGTILSARSGGGDPLLAAVARIPSSLRGQLAEALCRAGMTSDDEALRRAYFEAIAAPVSARFQQLVATPHFDSSQSVNDPRVQEELKLIVELYSGIARSAEAKSHALISAFSLPVLPVMVKVFELFHGDTQIVYLLLRFFCLLVEAQISYLTPKDALLVYTSCHELIRSYSRHNLGKKDAFADTEEDSYTDLLALLQLLSHLISKDFIDFSDATAESRDVEQATVFVADVVFAGLSQVIPLMTESLLQYPGLSKQYFTLVTYMIDVYAEKLAGLDPRLLGMLLHSLLFGIRHVQVDVARYSFQAIGELAGYHMKARQRDELGLQNHVNANPELFVHFIRVILRMALFEDFNPVILDACASALYPLILIERERYFALAEELRVEQTDPIVQERLMRAFQALTSFLKPGDLAMGTVATRKFRLLFKSHLFRFVADVRGFIQVKSRKCNLMTITLRPPRLFVSWWRSFPKKTKDQGRKKQRAMAARRVEAMSKDTSELLAASYAVPDLVVAIQEAVYNAIDACASHVAVIVDAAQASFTVVDDGDGIHPDEMFEHIFECKASSKANEFTRKYGSRGQYLAALCTLSKEVELDSRVQNHWTSFRKVVQKRRVVFNARSKITKATKGTSLRVQNLFWWLPVRKSELEARVSARTRLAKHLGSFFQSMSMIWPTLSWDVSFPDAKVPRCVIPGATSCEERLRGVFGDILGSELEYIMFDVGDLPFTIRGYAGVVRDAGDGDAYLESPGWRQARAFYQFVFLDNVWLEDFQRKCCKIINHTAIRLELGIPIFVLKISAKTHEYELHSDGETRVVNLKRPEVLTQTLRQFVEALKARVIEADASIEAMAASEREEEKPKEPPLHGEVHAVHTSTFVPELFDEEIFGYREGTSGRQERVDADVCEDAYAQDEAEIMEGDGVAAEANNYEEDPGYFYEDADSFQEDGDGRYGYTDRLIYARERTDDWATPSTMIYEELPTTMVYEEPPTAMMCVDAYGDNGGSMTDPYARYHGCAHCGSCGQRGTSPSFMAENQQFVAYDQPLYDHPSGVGYEVYAPQSNECEYGYFSEHHDFGESTTVPHHANYHEYQGEYADDAPEATFHSIESSDGYFEQETEEHHEGIPGQDPRAQTTAQHHQEREFDQLFFGKSLPRGPSRPRESRRRQERVCNNNVEQTKTETNQWVSSRRVGVVDFANHTLDPEESKAESPRQKIQTHTTSAERVQAKSHKSDRDERNKCDHDVSDKYLGSDQLSEYFSLEKIVKAHPRSLGPAIARFASKRTALAGLVGAFGIEDQSRGVHVRKLPSDLHAPSAKVMTLDKTMLHHLQVIKQIDRKFILVKAALASPSGSPENGSARTLLLCIDQHAADERVRLEQLELQVFGVNGDERNVHVVDQEPPLVLSLNDRERDTLSIFADEIRSWGFRFQNADQQVVQLMQTPRIDSRVAGADDLREYLQLLARSDAIVARRVVRPPVITRFLHSRACRSAIMFGDYLSFSQCQDIVEQLRHCSLPFQCAHGRPSIVPLVELM